MTVLVKTSQRQDEKGPTGANFVNPASASTPAADSAGKMSEEADTTWGMLPDSWSRLPERKGEPRLLEEMTRVTCTAGNLPQNGKGAAPACCALIDV